ncbi:hypothetical protein [Robertkochia sediminum]|uniref:hypothetical protein n=1 Tax=Robertkochia sediminum TaxID=2785326 RepID=UPI001932ADF5|nr:hypothetical protein [Robertkochia sediminum]MBL7472054.1 hypothetical protein [Robertkochia sediminum]
MNKLKLIFVLVLAVSVLSGCDFLGNALTYKDTTAQFVEALIAEDYDKSVSYMTAGNEEVMRANLDTLKAGLANFRKVVVSNFGEDLQYKFITAEKRFSTEEGEGTAPNTTLAHIQFSNTSEFGMFEITFDDLTNKILHIRILDVKEPIPGMILYWVFGLLAISVPVFNILVIRMIKKSDLKRKWVKYMAVVCLNITAITYAPVSGITFEAFSLQVLFGFSFAYMGYLNSFWSFGIPLGGIYWMIKLKR